MPETLLSVQSATKRFGDVVALDSVDLDIHQGDIVGLVGSNGAGKTTLLRLLSACIVPPRGGWCWVTIPTSSTLEIDLVLCLKTPDCTPV